MHSTYCTSSTGILYPHPSIPLPLTVLPPAAPRCGFDDMVPKLWVERVNAVIPDLGFHVRWHGLWMEVAEGRCSLSIYNITCNRRM